MAKDWTELYRKYKGQWVALKDDEITVIVSGVRLKDVLLQAKAQGYEKPIVTRVPKHNRTVCPFLN